MNEKEIAIWELIDKMEQQLRKHKEKVQHRHRNSGHRQQGDASRPERPSP